MIEGALLRMWIAIVHIPLRLSRFKRLITRSGLKHYVILGDKNNVLKI